MRYETERAGNCHAWSADILSASCTSVKRGRELAVARLCAVHAHAGTTLPFSFVELRATSGRPFLDSRIRCPRSVFCPRQDSFGAKSSGNLVRQRFVLNEQ
jgi:hypothetical protein